MHHVDRILPPSDRMLLRHSDRRRLHTLRTALLWLGLLLAGWSVASLLISLRVQPNRAWPAEDVATFGSTGLYAVEPDARGQPFCWTNGDALLMLPVERATGTLTLQLAAPSRAQAAHLALGDQISVLPPGDTPRAYRLIVPRSMLRHASLRARLVSTTFSVPGDGRTLGVMLFGASWRRASLPLPNLVVSPGLLAIGLLLVLATGSRSLVGAARQTLAVGGRTWRGLLSGGSIRAIPASLAGLLRADRIDRLPLFRAALIGTVLIQANVFNGLAPRSDQSISIMIFAGLLLALVAIVLRGPAITALLLALSVLAGVALRVYWATTPTESDVYWATMQACEFLLRGINPYTARFSWVGIQPNYDWFGYYPAIILSQLPFYLLGDVRWSLVVCDLVTIGLVFLLARRWIGLDVAAAVATFLLLYMPLSEFTIAQGIVDPIMLFWIVLSLYLLATNHWTGAALATGLAVASKQYAALYALAALAYLLSQRQRRAALLIAVVPAAIVAPFFALAPGPFMYDTLWLHMRLPPIAVLWDSIWNLSLTSQIVGLFGWTEQYSKLVVKPIAGRIMAAAIGLVALANLWRPSWERVIGASVMLLALTFALNGNVTQFFYWRNVIVLGLLWMLCGLRGRGEPGEPSSA